MFLFMKKEQCVNYKMSWLFNIVIFPSLCRPKEFIECVSHIRQLSWLLLGSLTHCALHQGSTSCMPIPLDAGSHIADHLIVILIGFPEQSKVWPIHWLIPSFVNPIWNHLTAIFYFGLDLCPQTSVLHMCSLFHAFMFAQLWTIYCEQAAAAPSPLNQNQTEFSSSALLTGLEFWSRVTPSIMQLMAHNKVVSALPLGSKLAQIRGLIMCFIPMHRPLLSIMWISYYSQFCLLFCLSDGRDGVSPCH